MMKYLPHTNANFYIYIIEYSFLYVKDRLVIHIILLI